MKDYLDDRYENAEWWNGRLFDAKLRQAVSDEPCPHHELSIMPGDGVFCKVCERYPPKSELTGYAAGLDDAWFVKAN